MTLSTVCSTTQRFSRSRSTGKERDTESGNDYFGARYYASSMGRFMSPDPSVLDYADPTNPQSLNLYAYVQNNPLNSIDPDGLKCFQVDGDGNLTGSSNDGDCATDANGNPTNNDIYVDDEKASNPFLDTNGDLLGYTNGGGQQVGADGNPFPNAGTLGANGFGTPLNDIDTQIAPSAFEFIQDVNQDNQHQIGCIAQAYGIGAPATTTYQLGQPVAGTKRFVSPGSSLGTSPLSDFLSKAAPMKGRFRAPVGGPGTGIPFKMTKTGNLGRAAARWAPFVALAADAYATIQLWNCLGK